MGSHLKDISSNIKMKSLVILLSALALTQSAFCPGEKKNGKRCLAKPNTYKCGVFLEDLIPKKPLTWLGALPDALKKVEKEDYQIRRNRWRLSLWTGQKMAEK